ncbi:MAG TPA: hypothetical protein VLZ51_05345 [Brevundimonas sp.]|nr:hypothetical protein [Brevundimonas sp.]
MIEATTGLLRARGVEQTRAEYIAAGLAEKNVAAESEYGRELAHTLGLTYDVIAAENARKKEQETADSGVANLQAQQQALMEAITFATEQGQMGVVGELQTQLQGVNAELLTAIDAALAFYRALDPATNPSAAAAILGLMNTRNAVAAVGTTAVASGKQINESIANGGAQAFDRFAQAVAEGKNVFESARDAFLQFAADFLREIAQMILKQAILNALGGGKGGGGGVGGAIASAINSLFRHNGGMAGSGGGYKSVWAGHFASATRYHSGGVVGLKPNEVPIIAERGEEVLDAGDPRHRDNGGLGGGAPVNLKNVNLFDIDQLASAILESEVGQKVLINVIGNNARAVSGALGR